MSNLRKASSADYSSLAMELELLGLEARIKDNVAEYVSRLTNTVKRRAISQVERVSETLQKLRSTVLNQSSSKKTIRVMSSRLL